MTRFASAKGIDFPWLLAMIHDSFMTRPNVITVPGGKMELENKRRGTAL